MVLPVPRALAVTVVGVALSLAACGGNDDKGTVTPRKTPTTTEQPSTTAAATAGEAAALEQLLIAEVPAGFERQADDVGDTGPSDLEKAIRDDGSDDARGALTKAGFVAGYQRLWLNAKDDEIIVFLYKFNDAAGATAYHQRSLADTAGATEFAVTGIPGAKGVQHDASDGTSTAVLFTKGQYLVQIISNTAGPQGQAEVVTNLATAQHKRLPGTVV